MIDSTGALELDEVPERLLVIGGGIIGLEMATVYDALGSRGHRRRAAGPAHPGLRPRPRAAAAQAHRGPLRGDPPQDVGQRGRGARRRAARHVRGRAASRPSSTASSSPSAARPNGERHRRRRRRRRGRRARLHPRRRADAHERPAHLRDRRRRRRADAGPQGHARGQGRRRGDRRPRRRVRRRDDPVGRLHRPRGRLDGPDRDEAKAEGIEYEKARVPVGGVRPRARRSAAPTARRSCCWSRRRAGSSAPASPASTPASCWPRPCWPSSWAPSPRTSPSPSTRTRRCRRPCVRRRDGRGHDHRRDAAAQAALSPRPSVATPAARRALCRGRYTNILPPYRWEASIPTKELGLTTRRPRTVIALAVFLLLIVLASSPSRCFAPTATTARTPSGASRTGRACRPR